MNNASLPSLKELEQLVKAAIGCPVVPEILSATKEEHSFWRIRGRYMAKRYRYVEFEWCGHEDDLKEGAE